MKYGKINPNKLDYNWLSEWFIKFYKRSPWNEYKMCPRCKRPDDFGPEHTWGIKNYPEKCPICQTRPVYFWSPERVEKYIDQAVENGFLGYGAWDENDNLAGWILGYDLPEEKKEEIGIKNNDKYFYLDVIGILPQYRRGGRLAGAVQAALAIIKVRFFLCRRTLLDRWIERMGDASGSITGHIYFKMIDLLCKNGYNGIATRTHTKSSKIKKIAKIVNLKEGNLSSEDRERRYYYLTFPKKGQK